MFRLYQLPYEDEAEIEQNALHWWTSLRPMRHVESIEHVVDTYICMLQDDRRISVRSDVWESWWCVVCRKKHPGERTRCSQRQPHPFADHVRTTKCRLHRMVYPASLTNCPLCHAPPLVASVATVPSVSSVPSVPSVPPLVPSVTTVPSVSSHSSVLSVPPSEPHNKRLECVVCMENEKTILIVPCHHVSTCEACIQRLVRCPICQVRIETTTRIYF